MRQYSLYDAATGLFVDRTFGTDVVGDPEHTRVLAANTPAGHGVVEGVHDHLSRRVDVGRLAREDDQLATEWAAKREERELAATLQPRAAVPGQKSLPPKDPPPPRTLATVAHVVDYQPPQPSADHEWHKPSKRWRLTEAAQAAQLAHQVALAQITTLEASQPRALREAVLGQPAGLERLRSIDSQIAALREQLSN